MRHLNDRTLDRILHGGLTDPAEEEAIAAHARECPACAARLREWARVFPEAERLAPELEPAMAQAPGAPNPQVVYIPDWAPPPSAPVTRAKIGAWGLVLVLGGVVIFLLARGGRQDTLPDLAEAGPESPLAQPAGEGEKAPAAPEDSPGTGLGSGVAVEDSYSAPTASEVPETRVAPARSQAQPATPPPAAVPRQEPEPVSRQPVRRDATPRFPIKSPEKEASAARPPEPSGARPQDLPTQFTRVSLGDAIAQLGGDIRTIRGLQPDAVELAAGSILPGADPDLPLVRMIFSTPDGRVILDQQRLGRGGSREPDIAISSTPSGVSVAQWVDWGGFWLSLAGRTTQEELLSLANRIGE